MSPELRRSLIWWRDVLALDLAELRPWNQSTRKVAHLFCDAAGAKPALGAVLLVDGECLWTYMRAPQELLAQFKARGDNQIMGLELLAISLGLSTFDTWLKHRDVMIYCDNSGAEV